MDISKLERERTHRLWCELEDGAGSVFILLTVSGMTNVETISDLLTYQEDPEQTDGIRRQFVSGGYYLQTVRECGGNIHRQFVSVAIISADS